MMNFESCPTLFYPCVVSMYSTPALGIYPSLVGLQTLPLKITPSFSTPQPPPSLNSPSAFSSSLLSRFMSVTLRFGGTQDAQKAMGLLLHDKLFLVCVSLPFYGGVCFFNFRKSSLFLLRIQRKSVIPHSYLTNGAFLTPISILYNHPPPPSRCYSPRPSPRLLLMSFVCSCLASNIPFTSGRQRKRLMPFVRARLKKSPKCCAPVPSMRHTRVRKDHEVRGLLTPTESN